MSSSSEHDQESLSKQADPDLPEPVVMGSTCRRRDSPALSSSSRITRRLYSRGAEPRHLHPPINHWRTKLAFCRCLSPL
ncbi:hypothetical protein BJX70DRAFT_121650 [Aspergillus crustosus]